MSNKKLFSWIGVDQSMMPMEPNRTESDQLLVVGSATCVWNDLLKVSLTRYDTMCLNDMIMHFPSKVDYGFSNDRRWLTKWIAARRPRLWREGGVSIEGHTVKFSEDAHVKAWPWPGFGTSALNAAMAGLAMGYGRVVLAGCPVDDSGHYFDPPRELIDRLPDPYRKWAGTKFNEQIVDIEGKGINTWYQAAANGLNGRVKSLSGRTEDLLGGP